MERLFLSLPSLLHLYSHPNSNASDGAFYPIELKRKLNLIMSLFNIMSVKLVLNHKMVLIVWRVSRRRPCNTHIRTCMRRSRFERMGRGSATRRLPIKAGVSLWCRGATYKSYLLYLLQPLLDVILLALV